jgi:hypothetical protein
VATDAQIKHASRKLLNATKMGEQVANDHTTQKEKLGRLERDLASVRKDADAAQGAV